MKRNHLKRTLLMLGTLASSAGVTAAYAQSADALINKLVDKGIITADEAKSLKAESDQGFTKAYQVKSGLSDWVSSFKFNGDFRGRAEGFDFDNNRFPDRLRYRYRLRLGATAVIKDNFEVGLRLTSSDTAGGFTSGDPISGNSTLQDNGSKKFVFVDLAYGKWTPFNQHGITDSLTLGKMENPFVFSDMVFDHDYTPEGIANALTYNLNSQHALKLNLAAFMLDELSADSRDPYLFGAQARWDAKWSDHWNSTLGVAGMVINNKENLGNAAVPNVNAGNSRTAGGALLSHYNPIVADGALTYTFATVPMYKGAFPVRLYGEFLHNPAARRQDSGYMGGLSLGKTGKKGTWAVDYRYKYLEADAWYEEFTDSDYGALYATAPFGSGRGTGYAAGTGVKGHVITGAYSVFDALTLQFRYFLTDLIQNPGPGSSTAYRFQVDATWKF